jgi:hypothetical protein
MVYITIIPIIPAEAGRSWIWGQTELHSETLSQIKKMILGTELIIKKPYKLFFFWRGVLEIFLFYLIFQPYWDITEKIVYAQGIKHVLTYVYIMKWLSQSSIISIISHSYFAFVMRILKLYPLSKFQICNTLTLVTMQYCRSPEFIHLLIARLYLKFQKKPGSCVWHRLASNSQSSCPSLSCAALLSTTTC